jgi:hypothetical protein
VQSATVTDDQIGRSDARTPVSIRVFERAREDSNL